jgi:hypothetical protein
MYLDAAISKDSLCSLESLLVSKILLLHDELHSVAPHAACVAVEGLLFGGNDGCRSIRLTVECTLDRSPTATVFYCIEAVVFKDGTDG